VASIARQCSASERGIRILCDFLTIYGVLVKEDGRYRHTPTSAAFLDPRSPLSLASIAQFLSNKAMLDPYEHLAEIVRTGRTVLPGDGSVEPENPIWVQFAETMAPMMAPMVGPLGAVGTVVTRYPGRIARPTALVRVGLGLGFGDEDRILRTARAVPLREAVLHYTVKRTAVLHDQP
jgi:hypothetical protein